jgi:hypothetical protein
MSRAMAVVTVSWPMKAVSQATTVSAVDGNLFFLLHCVIVRNIEPQLDEKIKHRHQNCPVAGASSPSLVEDSWWVFLNFEACHTDPC